MRNKIILILTLCSVISLKGSGSKSSLTDREKAIVLSGPFGQFLENRSSREDSRNFRGANKSRTAIYLRNRIKNDLSVNSNEVELLKSLIGTAMLAEHYKGKINNALYPVKRDSERAVSAAGHFDAKVQERVKFLCGNRDWPNLCKMIENRKVSESSLSRSVQAALSTHRTKQKKKLLEQQAKSEKLTFSKKEKK